MDGFAEARLSLGWVISQTPFQFKTLMPQYQGTEAYLPIRIAITPTLAILTDS